MSQQTSLSRPIHTNNTSQGQPSLHQQAVDNERVQLRQRGLRTVPPLILICFLFIGATIAAALFANQLAPFHPEENHLVDRLLPPFTVTEAQSSYLLGTDALGRDVLSRLIYGARVSLAIGFVGTLIGLLVGTLSGLLSGFIGGLFDEIMMFLVDAYIAIPFLIVALTAIAIFGSSIPVLMVLAGFSGWASYTRLARSQVLSVNKQPYVLAAQSIGAHPWAIMLRHILPNIAAPLVVLATFGMTSIILLESSLSFLGLGVQPPTPAWGSMLGDGRDYLSTAWWIGIIPGAAIMLLTMSISLIGDWLRDVLDPTLRGK